jgi:hypothetical protein
MKCVEERPIFFENGRLPHLKKIKDDFNLFRMEDNLQNLKAKMQPKTNKS